MFGSDHPLRDPCRALAAAVRDGKVLASTTPEVNPFASLKRVRYVDPASRQFLGELR